MNGVNDALKLCDLIEMAMNIFRQLIWSQVTKAGAVLYLGACGHRTRLLVVYWIQSTFHGDKYLVSMKGTN